MWKLERRDSGAETNQVGFYTVTALSVSSSRQLNQGPRWWGSDLCFPSSQLTQQVDCLLILIRSYISIYVHRFWYILLWFIVFVLFCFVLCMLHAHHGAWAHDPKIKSLQDLLTEPARSPSDSCFLLDWYFWMFYISLCLYIVKVLT